MNFEMHQEAKSIKTDQIEEEIENAIDEYNRLKEEKTENTSIITSCMVRNEDISNEMDEMAIWKSLLEIEFRYRK